MSWRHRERWALLVAVWLLQTLLATGEATAQSDDSTVWKSDGEVGAQVLRETLSPIEDAARANGAQLISLRVVDTSGSDRSLESLTEAIGNFFWDAGYEVQIRGPRTEVEEGAWTLDLTVSAATVDSPEKRGSFLGLTDGKILRRALVTLSGRLQDPVTGHWYWKGSPSVTRQSWIDASDNLIVGSDRPEWAGAVPSVATVQGSSWWEKSVVAGLLAGVVTLYFSGAN